VPQRAESLRDGRILAYPEKPVEFQPIGESPRGKGNEALQDLRKE